MIRRIIRELNVRALASDVRRRAGNAFHRNVFVDLTNTSGCVLLGPRRADVGAGFVLDNNEPGTWPDHARLLTIGRVTLAAWGGRSS
jgi:hypothetical protein